MEFEPEEQQIVELLSKLKNQSRTYPKKLLAARREVFLGQMASVGLGLGIGAGLKTVTKSSKGGSLFHLSTLPASSLTEIVLVVAIVAQASVIAYSYRDRIAELINSLSTVPTPTTVLIPVTGSSQPAVVISDTPTVSATNTFTITPTALSTSTATTVPSQSGSTNGNSAISNPEVTSTPPKNNNNGNHYGQTPRPTRQKNDPRPTKDTRHTKVKGNRDGKKH